MKPTLAFLAGLVLGALAVRAVWTPYQAPQATRVLGPDPAPAAGPEPQPAVLQPDVSLAPKPGEDEPVLEALRRLGTRIDAIDQRLAGLERRPARTEPADAGDLRGVVESVLVLAEEHEQARRERDAREARSDEAERIQREIRFQSELAISGLAQDLGLLPAQREALTAAVIRIQERRLELQRSLDPNTTDPSAWQEEYRQLDEELSRELERILGPELAARAREYL